MKRPTYSIVIPTRSRAHLLRHALRSALNQTFGDCEIVISDNYSDDDTRDVAMEAADERVRYVRTPALLSMPDSWEFALSHATGEWITFLCDDDAIVPELLETIESKIDRQRTKAVTWGSAAYYHDNWYAADQRNQLQLWDLTGDVVRYESDAVLRAMFDQIWPAIPFPRMLQSFVSADVVDAIRARAGRFFFPSCPDFSTCIAVLSEVDHYMHIDLPLMIGGGARESIGASALEGARETTNRFFREFDGVDVYENVPIKHACGVTSFVADTLLRTRKAVGGRSLNYELNWVNYYARCLKEIQSLRNKGQDVDEYERAWRDAFDRLPDQMRQAVQSALEPEPRAAGRLPDWLRKRMMQLRENAWVRKMEYILRPGIRQARDSKRRNAVITVRGEDEDFSDIAQCAGQLTRIWRKSKVAWLGNG